MININKLQEFLERNFLNIHSPGYVIEMFYNNTNLEFVLGNKSILPIEIPTSKNVLYDIASLTKLFTAVLIYKAYEENLLNLDQSVFSINNKFIYLQDITILDLLCHNQEIYTNGYLGDAKTIQEFNEILYSAYVLKTVPTYVDVDYIILANILEKIYKSSFDKIIHQKIIKPLKLKSTTFKPNFKNCASSNYESIDDTVITDLPLGVVHDKKARNAQKLGIYTGHAGLFSTGEDMMKFLMTFFDYSLLKKETIQLMLQHNDINNYNLKILKSYINKDLEINELYKLVKKDYKDLYLPNTYNFMGCRYHNDILEKNDVPLCLSKNSITFSGYTGPMFVIDFEQKIIVLVMCNVLHNTHLDRVTRKNKTSEIINFILNNMIQK